MTNPKVVFAGEITHLAGVAAVVAGLVMILHQWPVAAALLGGGTAYVVGRKLRGGS